MPLHITYLVWFKQSLFAFGLVDIGWRESCQLNSVCVNTKWIQTKRQQRLFFLGLDQTN